MPRNPRRGQPAGEVGRRKPAARRRVAPPRPAARPVPNAGGPAAPPRHSSADRYEVVLRFPEDGAQAQIAFTTKDGDFYPVAQEWRYVIANRQRITRDTRDALSAGVFEAFRELTGLDADVLRNRVNAMARAETVEVEIPYAEESWGWAARVFPWESVLGLLTKPYREETSAMTVVRHLNVRPEPALHPPPTKLLLVRSGPGELGRMFDLEHECQMVAQRLGLQAESLNEPDRTALQARVQAFQPSIVHLAGVDPLALEMYDLATLDREQREGFVLRGDRDQFDCVSPLDLASILTSAPTKPILVAVSTCFSAPRVAALAAALGACHAIGFQDTITDADALVFFGAFYRALMDDGAVLPAFAEARAQLMRQAQARGAGGVVLWSRHSLLAPRPETAVPRPRKGRPAQPEDLKLYITTGARAQPFSLNYSLLHNNRSPFQAFVVDKPVAGKLPPLRVDVSLEVGDGRCRCRFAEELPEEAGSTDLAQRIRLPLVAGLLRQCSESLRTNLYIRVECGQRLLCERNERVSLLPADEWRDDGEDHRWLPSFVLPRDAAVQTVITAAQRYLFTLLDDCRAGFDGYQRLADDGANAAEVVDPQVQAIWAALQHDAALNYINPPPSYSSQSQRLRSPTQIFAGKVATCIDLALLFASCLEYVGIYPVIFLVTGHAFPGYWRSDRAWWQLREFGSRGVSAATPPPGGPQPPVLAPLPASPGQGEGWMFAGVGNLAELLRYVEAGSLVPFESTFVALERGFFEALEQGPRQLDPQTFDAMIDVQTARGEDVTPLPLLDRREERT